MPLLLHGEVTQPDIDIFDREAVFIERHLKAIVDGFPNLKLVLEHITTKEGVDFVIQARDGVAGSLTAHHLLLNRKNFSWEPIARPMLAMPRKPAVAAQACIPRMQALNFMQKPSRQRERWINWKHSPAFMGPISTDCLAIQTPSSCKRKVGRSPPNNAWGAIL